MPFEWKKPYRIARRNLGAAVLPFVGPRVVAALARTWSYDVVGEGNLAATEADEGRLVALWHGRMLVGTPRHRDSGWSILVSPSDDGALMQVLLDRFGYAVIRGSTSQGGARALRRLLEVLRRGGTIVLTPDGPRGPRHSMNQGLAWMASRTGFPVVPVGFACDRARRLGSWDAFTIPRRGARIAVCYGEPLRIAPDLPGAALERETERLREALLAAERRAFERLGIEPDFA